MKLNVLSNKGDFCGMVSDGLYHLPNEEEFNTDLSFDDREGLVLSG